MLMTLNFVFGSINAFKIIEKEAAPQVGQTVMHERKLHIIIRLRRVTLKNIKLDVQDLVSNSRTIPGCHLDFRFPSAANHIFTPYTLRCLGLGHLDNSE